jgi:hypothetical protein
MARVSLEIRHRQCHGNKLTIKFDHTGEKRVVDRFCGELE